MTPEQYFNWQRKQNFFGLTFAVIVLNGLFPFLAMIDPTQYQDHMTFRAIGMMVIGVMISFRVAQSRTFSFDRPEPATSVKFYAGQFFFGLIVLAYCALGTFVYYR